ncbi:MAG TPA: hypothetical protein VN280_22355 [Variovorax sp.]|nr:hypothetical protein [Variovorax sp.]
MTTETEMPPTVDERLAVAANTSDMTLTPERQGVAIMLIAAAKTPRVVGRHLISLYGEWDGCAKPRKLLEQEVTAIRKSLPAAKPPLVLSQKLMEAWPEKEFKRRQKRAEEIAAEWYESQRLHAFGRLKSFKRVRTGLIEILGAKIDSPEVKVGGVLAWWLDSACPKCNGTGQLAIAGNGRQSLRPCPSRHRGGCDATGQRALPHGLDGRLIEATILECIGKARQHIAAFGRELRRELR